MLSDAMCRLNVLVKTAPRVVADCTDRSYITFEFLESKVNQPGAVRTSLLLAWKLVNQSHKSHLCCSGAGGKSNNSDCIAHQTVYGKFE